MRSRGGGALAWALGAAFGASCGAGCNVLLGLHDKSVADDGGAGEAAADGASLDVAPLDARAADATSTDADAAPMGEGGAPPIEAGPDASSGDAAGDGAPADAKDASPADASPEAAPADAASEGPPADAAPGDAGTCGNGVLDPGEACDPSAPGGSPPSCGALFGHGATGTSRCTSCALDESGCALPQLQAGAAWPMFERTLTHASRSPAHGPHVAPAASQVQLIMSMGSGNVSYLSMAIDAAGTVYQPVVDYSGVDAGLWIHRRGASTVTSVTVPLVTADTNDCGLVGGPAIAADGTVYVQSGGGWLYVLHPAADGGTPVPVATQPSTATPDCSSGLQGGPAIDADGTVYVTFGDGLYAYSPSTGTAHGLVNCQAHYPPVIGADGTVTWIGYYSPSDVCAYAPSTGTPAYSQTMPSYSTSAPVLGLDGRVFATQPQAPGGFYAFTPPLSGAAGVLLLGSVIATMGPAVGADGTLYLASYDGTLYALDPHATAQTTPRWMRTLGGNIGSAPVVDADGYAYLVGTDGTLYATDASGKLAWSLPLAGGTANYDGAMDWDGTLYVGVGSRVYAISP